MTSGFGASGFRVSVFIIIEIVGSFVADKGPVRDLSGSQAKDFGHKALGPRLGGVWDFGLRVPATEYIRGRPFSSNPKP